MSPVGSKNVEKSDGSPKASRATDVTSKGLIQAIEDQFKKKAVVDIRSGDTVKVHQKVREGGKERIQIFEGLVIRVSRKNSLTASITVRRIASGIGVEKNYLVQSPSITKIEITKRSKVRRNYLSYMRGLRGKGARLSGVDFDREAVNTIADEAAEAAEAKLKEDQAKQHEVEAAKKAEAEAKEEVKFEKAMAEHNQKTTAEKPETKTKTGDEPKTS